MPTPRAEAVALPAFVKTLPEWVRVVRLPTPFHVGRVNCYVLPDPPVTLIDPGTLEPGSPAQVRAVLRANGLDLDDVEQIVVTHAHADHCGAAAVLAARTGARVVCGLPETTSLVEPEGVGARRAVLAALGVPASLAADLVAGTDVLVARLLRRPLPSMVTGVSDGETLAAGGRELRCIVTPGHSDGHLSLWDATERVLFSGDHLLGRLIPAPSLQAGAGPRRRSLIEYLASLPQFVALEPKVVLPGHGRPFTDVDVLAARQRAHSRRRAAEIEAILRAGPATPFQVTSRLQWQPEGARLLLGLAHTQGHLDLLEDDGRVVAHRDGAAVSYRLPQ